MKTSELVGVQLDWAVAKCEENHTRYQDYRVTDGELCVMYCDAWLDRRFSPSTDWALGGPIIEREEIGIKRRAPCFKGEEWEASPSITAKGAGRQWGYGPTPLIAAMRCHVALSFGDEVEVPEELI